MTTDEQEYLRDQGQIERGGVRFINAILSIKNRINSLKAKATLYFGFAGTNGARDVLMSAASISCANENRMLAGLTPAESVSAFAAIAALAADETPDAGTSAKVLLIAQRIALGHQLSNLSDASYDIASNFDLQIQTNGSVVVDDL